MLNVNIKNTILFSNYKAEFFLLLSTILWGSTFPIIKIGLHWFDPFILIFLRFFIALFMMTLLFIFDIIPLRGLWNRSILIKGLALGFIGFLSYLSQTLGLQYTTPPRSAFITQMLIIFVYLFQFIFLRKAILTIQWLSLILILLGSYILFFGFNFDFYQNLNHNFKGDLLTFLCAIGFALYIIMIDGVQKHEFFSVVWIHFFVISLFPLFFTKSIYIDWNVISLGSILYLSIFTTLLTTLILFYYQPQTTPVRASILYSLEPVFATLFSIFIIHSKLTFIEITGSILIFIGSIIGEIKITKKS